MSVHIPVEERHRLPWRRRLLPLVAVGAAHLIGRLSPRQIRRLLTWCARRARAATYAEAAATLLCRAHGTWSTWHTGVHTQPFNAHAWIEAEGRPVDARSFQD